MKKYIAYILVFAAGIAVATIYFHHVKDRHNYAEMHQSHHGETYMHKHDEINMQGLQGKDTTEKEVSDLKEIFRSHRGITRTVSNLTNGIVTITEAEDETLREAIVSHVSMMVTRLQNGKNPEVIIQSPTLDALFDVYGEIDTEIELTNTGVKIIQTSSNQDVVKLLQRHAAEVSDMAEKGMRAVHERMAGQEH